MKEYKTDCLIIGGGPAGVSAALQLKKRGVDFILVEKKAIGGLVRLARKITNSPLIYGKTGIEVANIMRNALIKSGIEPVFDKITNVEKSGEYNAFGENSYKVKSIIIATGTKPKKLVDNNYRNVFYGYDKIITNKEIKSVGVIGQGEIAVDQALSLHDRGLDVKIYFKNTLSNINFELLRELKKSKIKIINDAEFISIEESTNFTTYSYKKSNIIYKNNFDALLIAVGRIKQMIKLEDMDTNGIQTTDNITIAGMNYISLACNSGINAAEGIYKYLGG
jgi:thioredoxin reductase